MSDLRTAALRALEAMDDLHRTGDTQVFDLCHWETTEALRAALADTKVDSQAIAKQPSPPPEAQTEAEKIAYCAGWWDGLAKARASSTCEPLPPASPSQT